MRERAPRARRRFGKTLPNDISGNCTTPKLSAGLVGSCALASRWQHQRKPQCPQQKSPKRWEDGALGRTSGDRHSPKLPRLAGVDTALVNLTGVGNACRFTILDTTEARSSKASADENCSHGADMADSTGGIARALRAQCPNSRHSMHCYRCAQSGRRVVFESAAVGVPHRPASQQRAVADDESNDLTRHEACFNCEPIHADACRIEATSLSGGAVDPMQQVASCEADDVT